MIPSLALLLTGLGLARHSRSEAMENPDERDIQKGLL